MSSEHPKIFLLAGEASGDVLGASLIHSLKQQGSECIGIGGPLMEKHDFKSLMPMNELCVMGIWEVIWQLPRLLKLINAVVEEVEKEQPDVFVGIDLPDFNFQVAKRLKKRGIYKGKLIHYVAPTVWAWRPGRAKRIARFLDVILCLFPFEPKYFEQHNLDAKYVGHPLIKHDHRLVSSKFRERHGIAEDVTVFGVYLGSRESEIERHKGVFRDVLQFLINEVPNLQIVLPTLPDVEHLALNALEGLSTEPIVVSDENDKWDVMQSCNLAMAVSGTVGLELAYMNVPHVVAYKTHPITALIVKMLVKVRFAHLVNILMDKAVVPEFLQSRCKPILIVEELLRLLREEAVMAQQKMAFHDARRKLKKDVESNPSETAAYFILKACRHIQDEG